MTRERLPPVVRPLFGVAAGALFVDLFLDWRVASVVTPAVDLRAGTSGLSGWGAVAGVLLVVLLGWEVRLLLRDRDPSSQEVTISTGLALGAAGFAIVGFFTGEASVATGPVSVQVDDVRWPAYAGLVLAILLVAAAVARWLVEPGTHAARAAPAAPGSA